MAAFKNTLVLTAIFVVLLASFGCKTAYYSAWETVGREKRDLLRSNVESAQDEQQEAVEQFEDALDRLRSLYSIDAGDLEKTYDRLKADNEKAQERADGIRDRIDKVNTVAEDLFEEWEEELAEISNPDLRSKSRAKLDATKTAFGALASSLRRAEQSMDPVLTQLNDQVLFLKHNLNAAAIAGLGAETADIEADVEQLLADLRASIAEADRFLSNLDG